MSHRRHGRGARVAAVNWQCSPRPRARGRCPSRGAHAVASDGARLVYTVYEEAAGGDGLPPNSLITNVLYLEFSGSGARTEGRVRVSNFIQTERRAPLAPLQLSS